MRLVGAIALGVVTWLLAEYVLHRFVGHMPKGRSLFSREHRRHHSQGDYFAPTWTKIKAVTPVFTAIAALTSLAFGAALGLGYAGGLCSMYLAYEVLHRRLHTHPPTNRYGRWARRHHFYHHFGEPAMNHGVSTPVFDLVFRTHRVPGSIRVPERLAMAWLRDQETGEVREAFREDYTLNRLP